MSRRIDIAQKALDELHEVVHNITTWAMENKLEELAHELMEAHAGLCIAYIALGIPDVISGGAEKSHPEISKMVRHGEDHWLKERGFTREELETKFDA